MWSVCPLCVFAYSIRLFGFFAYLLVIRFTLSECVEFQALFPDFEIAFVWTLGPIPCVKMDIYPTENANYSKWIQKMGSEKKTQN